MDTLLVNLVLLGYIERDLSGLVEYCETVSAATGIPIPPNYPVVGRDAFRTATGVHAAAVIKAFRKQDTALVDAAMQLFGPVTGVRAELRALTRTTVSVETMRPAAELAELPGVGRVAHPDGARVSFDVDTDHLDDVMAYLAPLGIRSLVSHPPTLEELFLRHYGDELAGAGVDDAPALDGGRG